MGSELKHILKSLCCSHGWSFAVFWSSDQTNSMLLTMEDAYHDDEQVVLTLVDDILRQVHIFGQGIIGEAALTGNHRWMFSDTSDFQTILVVPIGSRGVVQFGSTKKILESDEVLNQTERLLQQKMNSDSNISESLKGTSFDDFCLIQTNLDDPLIKVEALVNSNSGSCKKRGKSKDREMIKDRIKELRGMIPNGSKCSIESLLDLTIKHMFFMQSIATYSDKLKQSYKPKKGWATWAFEVGDESVFCPIIVQDLNPPGLMQIQMLCEKRGKLLEIADVIKGLGLNILKGSMESKDDKIWAHFIVEAKGHMTRQEVFWSLVQFLQRDNDSLRNTNSIIDLPEYSDSVSVPFSFIKSF